MIFPEAGAATMPPKKPRTSPAGDFLKAHARETTFSPHRTIPSLISTRISPYLSFSSFIYPLTLVCLRRKPVGSCRSRPSLLV